MLSGFIFSGFFSTLTPLTPYMIFIMLFITFCRVTPGEMKFGALHFILLGVQLLGGTACYLALKTLDESAAQGIAICIIAPTAISSVVVGGMLGANAATMTTFTLLSNISVAVFAPLFFSFVGTHADIPFTDSFFKILVKVMPMLVIPFAAAFALRKISPKIHKTIGDTQIISFYIWSLALMIVTGQTVEFIKEQESANYRLEIYIAAAAFFVCVSQFITGRLIGKKYNDKIAGGQSLGQKNTILAIWMAQTYLNPISSIGPASYVLWQNLVNSWQIWQSRNEKHTIMKNTGNI